MERGRKLLGGKLILGRDVAEHLWAVLDYHDGVQLHVKMVSTPEVGLISR